MDVRTFLDGAGYESVPLAPSAVGHLHVQGRFNDRPVTVLIDTGASETVIDEGFARAEGLDLKRSTRSGGGAGTGRLPVHSVAGARLTVGDVEVAAGKLWVVDLGNVTAALARKGVAPPQVILGADVLSKRDAVIDYASGRLFFAPSGSGAQ